MGFEKGNTYGKGRIRGSKNNATKDIKEAFKTLVENNLETLQEDLDTLDPKDRLRFILDLAGFVIPKMKATQIDATINEVEVPLFPDLETIFEMKEKDLNIIVNEQG